MKIRTFTRFLGILGLGMTMLGCQGAVPTMGTMGPLSLQNPTRVPPPADGSYKVPGQYSPAVSASPNTTTANRPIGSGLADAADAWHGLLRSEVQGAVSEVKNAASNLGQRVNGVTEQVDQSARNAVGAVQAGYQETTRRLSNDLAPIGDSLQTATSSLTPTTNSSWKKPDGE